MPNLLCPTCSTRLSVTHQLAGKSIECARCGTNIHMRANQEWANVPETPTRDSVSDLPAPQSSTKTTPSRSPVPTKPPTGPGARWGLLLLLGLLLAGVSALIFFQSENVKNARTISITLRDTLDIGLSGANSNSNAPSLTRVAFRPITRDGFRRVALVIGNSTYKVGPLVNPANDAKSIGQALKAVGFEVVTKFDRSKYEMEDDVDEITSGLNDGDAIFIFYAGHGLQVDNVNYLVPVDARVTEKHHVRERCVRTEYLMAALEESEASLRVLVLDACRNNPFQSFSRSGKRGLRPIAAPSGTIVAYSTAPGTEALDGDGDNSPYAKHFVNKLRGTHPKGLEVNRLFREVAQAVRKETGQRPYRNFDDSMDDFMLIEAISGPPKTITNTIEAKLNLIPPGKFLMGSSESGELWHDVEITKGFYIGTTEVTQEQWFRVMKTRPWKELALEGLPFHVAHPKHPAGYINWDAANEFCRRLSQLEDRTYRLPTEAEWEYSCRSSNGRLTKYSFGNDESLLKEHACFRDLDNEKSIDKLPSEVAQKKPNGFGLFDMHGNVCEWCSDWMDKKYYSDSSIKDPLGPDSGKRRVLRGGAFTMSPKDCRSAARSGAKPTSSWAEFGFRIVLEAETAKK